MKTQLKDIYWLAGLLEGEGCFGLLAFGQPRIQLTMTDRDVIDRVAMIAGPAVKGPYRQSGNRQEVFAVTITGRKAAGWMMSIYPLMGQRRQSKIREALATWRASRNCHPMQKV